MPSDSDVPPPTREQWRRFRDATRARPRPPSPYDPRTGRQVLEAAGIRLDSWDPCLVLASTRWIALERLATGLPPALPIGETEQALAAILSDPGQLREVLRPLVAELLGEIDCEQSQRKNRRRAGAERI